MAVLQSRPAFTASTAFHCSEVMTTPTLALILSLDFANKMQLK